MIKNLLLIFMLTIAQIQIAWADYDGNLIRATEDGDLNRVKSLISKGADVNAKDGTLERTALIEASLNGHLEVVKYLVENGADVNAKNEYGVTVLMRASYYEHFEIVQYLVSKGANVNAKDKYGSTALSFTKTSEIRQFLINNGARE